MGYSIFAAQAYDFVPSDEDHDDASAADEPAAPDDTCARLEQSQTRRQLTGVVRRLPESERRIVFAHYFHLQTIEAIAFDMGLTKGRVSQLHHAALRRMREWGEVKELPRPA